MGIVERAEIIDGSKVRPGNVLVGLASSGPHSNGYSLIRKILQVSEASLESRLDERPLGELLLEPTRIYVNSVRRLVTSLPVHALCHVTGGGLLENLPRVLPNGTCARISRSSWQRPAIFDWLQNQGRIEAAEMLRTFNCGVGMVACLPRETSNEALALLTEEGETATVIGEIVPSDDTRIEFVP